MSEPMNIKENKKIFPNRVYKYSSLWYNILKMENEMKKTKWVAVKTKTGKEVHLGLGNFPLCNSRILGYKVSDDINKVTCEKCRENFPGVFKEKK
jgi:hypothetical protein